MGDAHDHRGTVRTPPRSQGVHHTGGLCDSSGFWELLTEVRLGSKVKNSQARTGHQRGMDGRGTDDDDTEVCYRVLCE